MTSLTKCILFAAAVLPLSAQVSVTGKVVDDTGTGIGDLKVSLVNQATKVAKEVRTAADGSYKLAAEPGAYSVAIEKPGRGTFAVRDIDLAAGGGRMVNLEMAGLTENRNFRYMFYGFLAAWLVLVLYVISLAAREKALLAQIANLRQMVESERR